MFLKISMAIAAIVVLFLGYVATRNGEFHYERSGVINAPPAKVYAVVSNFKLGKQWSPFEKMDPNIKETFSGTDGEVGSAMEFEGNKEVGSGNLEILKLVPNERVEIKLTMTKPFRSENLVIYTMVPEGDATRFTWTMEGNGGFMGKLIGVLIDCEKMVADQFTAGINNLKTLLEKAP